MTLVELYNHAMTGFSYAFFIIFCLFMIVGFLGLADFAISRIASYLKIYPLLIEFIWKHTHRKDAK